jgi:stress response protein YsnF
MNSLLTELPDYELVDRRQDIRGWDVRSAHNGVVGRVRDLVVDTDHDRVATVLLDDGTQIPTEQIAIRDDFVEVGGEGMTATAGPGEAVVPIAEERIAVTKRPVAKGGVRVESRVAETPVEREIDLRQEHISVERRPVDRLAPGGAFPEQVTASKEVTAKAEEAVVDKEARVVEDVVVTKEAREREATIRDQVRRTDVKVEPLPERRGGR